MGATAGGSVTYAPLTSNLTLEWWDTPRGQAETTSVLVVHGVRIGAPLSARERVQIGERLPTVLRSQGAVRDDEAVEVVNTANWVEARVQTARQDFRAVTQGRVLAVRLAQAHVSVVRTLPRDSMGAVIDEDDIAEAVRTSLLLIGTVLDDAVPTLAVALEVPDTGVITSGTINDLGRRSSAGMLRFGSNQPTRLVPDEQITFSDLPGQVGEVAHVLARLLFDQFHQRGPFGS